MDPGDTTGPRLRVLVYPHSMEVGGSQINALELAGAVRDRGHHVDVYCADGPLVDLVHRLGLRRIPARQGYYQPSPLTAWHLWRHAQHEGYDLVHAYEWPPALEAYLSTSFFPRRASVVTVMSMAVAPFIPESMPLVVGTERIRNMVAGGRSGSTYLIEPPVDTEWNVPAGRAEAFRREHGLQGALVVIVSRLAHELKLEGILTAIRTVDEIAALTPVHLVVVGDGPARREIEDVVEACRHNCVTLTGLIDDPRGAYEAADVLIGMGGSALRGLAFAKPLVVQGEGGFFSLLTPESAGFFLGNGWYGVDQLEPGRARQKLGELLVELLNDTARREDLGRYGRGLVDERFGLQQAAARQEAIYREALRCRSTPRTRLLDGIRGIVGLVRHKLARRVRRLRGEDSRDDFNARPV